MSLAWSSGLPHKYAYSDDCSFESRRRLLILPIRRHCLEQHVDQLLAIEAMSLSGVVAGDAVSKGRFGHRLHVGNRRVIAAIKNRAGLGARDERQHAARPGAPVHPLVDEL